MRFQISLIALISAGPLLARARPNPPGYSLVQSRSFEPIRILATNGRRDVSESLDDDCDDDDSVANSTSTSISSTSTAYSTALPTQTGEPEDEDCDEYDDTAPSTTTSAFGPSQSVGGEEQDCEDGEDESSTATSTTSSAQANPTTSTSAIGNVHAADPSTTAVAATPSDNAEEQCGGVSPLPSVAYNWSQLSTSLSQPKPLVHLSSTTMRPCPLLLAQHRLRAILRVTLQVPRVRRLLVGTTRRSSTMRQERSIITAWQVASMSNLP